MGNCLDPRGNIQAPPKDKSFEAAQKLRQPVVEQKKQVAAYQGIVKLDKEG